MNTQSNNQSTVTNDYNSTTPIPPGLEPLKLKRCRNSGLPEDYDSDEELELSNNSGLQADYKSEEKIMKVI